MNDCKTGMLVELDYCVGCYACQSACQNANQLPLTETYLRCILAKPEMVDGDMQSYMSPVPYDLTKCAACMEREGGEAPCAKICIGAALHFGSADEIRELELSASGRTATFF